MLKKHTVKKPKIIIQIIDHKEYFDDLEKEFPEIASIVNEERHYGDHIAMERFASYTILQIENKNHDEMQRCFQFQEDRIDNLNDGLLNALVVSYCESLLLGQVSSEMKILKNKLPPKLKKEYDLYEFHYYNLGKK